MHHRNQREVYRKGHMELATGAAQARGIFQVALMVKYFNAIMVTKGDVDSLPDKDKINFSGLLFSFVVLRAMAAELALKVLYTRKTGQTAIYTHNLIELFQALPDTTRKSIIQRFQSKGRQKSIQEVFDAHKNDFVNWRYAYQKPSLHTQFDDLEQAIESVLEEYGV